MPGSLSARGHSARRGNIWTLEEARISSCSPASIQGPMNGPTGRALHCVNNNTLMKILKVSLQGRITDGTLNLKCPGRARKALVTAVVSGYPDATSVENMPRNGNSICEIVHEATGQMTATYDQSWEKALDILTSLAGSSEFSVWKRWYFQVLKNTPNFTSLSDSDFEVKWDDFIERNPLPRELPTPVGMGTSPDPRYHKRTTGEGSRGRGFAKTRGSSRRNTSSVFAALSGSSNRRRTDRRSSSVLVVARPHRHRSRADREEEAQAIEDASQQTRDEDVEMGNSEEGSDDISNFDDRSRDDDEHSGSSSPSNPGDDLPPRKRPKIDAEALHRAYPNASATSLREPPVTYAGLPHGKRPARRLKKRVYNERDPAKYTKKRSEKSTPALPKKQRKADAFVDRSSSKQTKKEDNTRKKTKKSDPKTKKRSSYKKPSRLRDEPIVHADSRSEKQAAKRGGDSTLSQRWGYNDMKASKWRRTPAGPQKSTPVKKKNWVDVEAMVGGSKAPSTKKRTLLGEKLTKETDDVVEDLEHGVFSEEEVERSRSSVRAAISFSSDETDRSAEPEEEVCPTEDQTPTDDSEWLPPPKKDGGK
ncbi:unnamed protein product [Amoebophrya sp. A25]|nr:unnamed protein product [Amoebophrya sp. A25]|eukprot:GSA25T00027655001.1